MAIEEDGDSVLAYTRKWLDLINRGGLFPLNDDSFVEIEKLVLPSHAVLCNDSEKQAFQRSILHKIVSNDEIQFYWALLSKDIQENWRLFYWKSLWVTVRGYSLAAACMEQNK